MLQSEGEPVLYPWEPQYLSGSCSSWDCVIHSPGRRGCNCRWYKTNLCSVQSLQLLSEVEPLAAGEWQEILCVSASTREPGGRHGCSGRSQEITGVCRSECGICMGLCVLEPQHGWTSHEMLFVFAMPASVPVLHFCSPPAPVVYQRGDEAVLVPRL